MSTIKRRRYRIIRIFRPYVRMRRPIIHTPSHRIRPNRIQNYVSAVPEEQKPINTSHEEHQSENTTLPAQESLERIVSFPSTDNPYDHLVSQLPTMLGSIPNLIETCPPAPIADQTIQKAKVTTKLHLRWKSEPHTTVKQKAYWLDLRQNEKDIHRNFPWQGLPERSCRQIRYGGKTKSLSNSGMAISDQVEFLFQRLQKLADSHEFTLSWLMLLLTPLTAIREFLRASPVHQIGQIFLSFSDAKSNTPFQRLTLDTFLRQAVNKEYLSPNIDAVEVLIPYLDIGESKALSSEELYTYFENPSLITQQRLREINIDGSSIYIQIIAGQVAIYGLEVNPTSLSYPQFLGKLHAVLFTDTIDKQSTITLTNYTIPSQLESTLTEETRISIAHRKRLESLTFIEGIIPDTEP